MGWREGLRILRCKFQASALVFIHLSSLVSPHPTASHHLTPLTRTTIMAITVTPLAGSGRVTSDDSKAGEPFCYLLEIDGARILLDCGSRDWEANADSHFSYERKLKE